MKNTVAFAGIVFCQYNTRHIILLNFETGFGYYCISRPWPRYHELLTCHYLGSIAFLTHPALLIISEYFPRVLSMLFRTAPFDICANTYKISSNDFVFRFPFHRIYFIETQLTSWPNEYIYTCKKFVYFLLYLMMPHWLMWWLGDSSIFRTPSGELRIRYT